MLALLLPLARSLNWREPGSILPIAGLIAATPVVFYEAYGVLLIEPLLTVTLGHVLLCVVDVAKQERYAWVHLSVAAAFLTLLKDAGFALALIALILMAILLWRHGRPVGTTAHMARFWALRLGVPAAAVLLTRQSWKWTLAVNAHPPRSSSATPAEMAEALIGSPETAEYRIETTQAFVRALSTSLGTTTLPLSAVSWLAILVVVTGVLETLGGRRRPISLRNMPVTVGMTLGWALYVLGVWGSYMTSFSEYEAVRLASFTRYMSTFLAGWMVLVVGMATQLALRHHLPRPLRRVSRPLQLTALLLALLSVIPMARLTDVPYGTKTRAAAVQRESTNKLKSVMGLAGVKPGDRIWFIDQYSIGFPFWVMRYEMHPSELAPHWSIGTPQNAEDVWTKPYTASRWQSELAAYDWVAILNPHPTFIEEFGSVFEDPTQIARYTVFKVLRSPGGEVYLSRAAVG